MKTPASDGSVKSNWPPAKPLRSFRSPYLSSCQFCHAATSCPPRSFLKPHSSPPSKTSEFAIEGDLPRLLTIGLHEAPRSNILWTVSLSYLVSEPAVGPRMKLPIETGRMMGGRWNRAPRHLPSRAIILSRIHR